jgi:hypothetical protein
LNKNKEHAMTTDTALPAQFAHLQPLVAEWAQPTERDRAFKRISTPMAELIAFQGKLLPELEAIIAHLDGFPNDPHALPPDSLRLFRLAQMTMEVSAPIDLEWEQPEGEDAFPLARMTFLSPSV